MATGRPREFDLDERLDIALQVFWRQGYEGTALSDLTEAMGINRPSLYAAYGNKEALFFKALDRYAEGPARHVQDCLREPTARAAAETLLRGAVRVTTREEGPIGCMFVQSALATGAQSTAVRNEVHARRATAENALRERFERAKAEGDLPASVDAAELSHYVWTVSYGISVQATGGATRDELDRIVDLALANWPVGSQDDRAQRGAEGGTKGSGRQGQRDSG